MSDEHLTRVAVPEARTIVLQGCRYLSGLDGDRAVEENGIGWSKTTSWTGHWLAGHEALDEREAAVASCAPGADDIGSRAWRPGTARTRRSIEC